MSSSDLSEHSKIILNSLFFSIKRICSRRLKVAVLLLIVEIKYFQLPEDSFKKTWMVHQVFKAAEKNY